MFEKEKEPWIVVVQAPWSSHGKLSATEMCFDFHWKNTSFRLKLDSLLLSSGSYLGSCTITDINHSFSFSWIFVVCSYLACQTLTLFWLLHLTVPWNHSYYPLTTLLNKCFYPFAQALFWEELPSDICKLTSFLVLKASWCLWHIQQQTGIWLLTMMLNISSLFHCFPVSAHVPTDVSSFMLRLSPPLGKSIFCDLLVQHLILQYNLGSRWEYKITHQDWMVLGNCCISLCRKTANSCAGEGWFRWPFWPKLPYKEFSRADGSEGWVGSGPTFPLL